MQQKLWTQPRADEYARYFEEEPPWLSATNEAPTETATSWPLPKPGLLDANKLSKYLWLLILEQLPVPELRQTASIVCRGFHDLSVSILYRDIDASIHHYKADDFLGNYNYDFAKVAHFRPERVGRQHCRFVRQMLQRPEYGTHVRSFIWTIDVVHTARFDLSLDREVEQVCNQFRIFSFLQNVTTVDIDGGLTALPILPHNASLFPQAQHIRLGGLMQWSVVSAILHGRDKGPLHTLILDNLIESGHYHDGVPYAYRHHVRNRNAPGPILHPMLIEEDWPSGSPPRQVRPGCMRRILTPELSARCKSISKLFLRKQGQQHYQQVLPSNLTFDEEVYMEWADFIAEVKPKFLRLEHGGSTLFPWNGGMVWKGELPITVQDIAPMDQRFADFISPILMEGWDRLQFLEIHGVCDSVTAPIIRSLNRRRQHGYLECDPTLTWCWNGEVSHSRNMDCFIDPRRPGLEYVALARERPLRMIRELPNLLDRENDKEYWREQDRMSRFMFEEGLISKADLDKRLNGWWRGVKVDEGPWGYLQGRREPS